MKFPLIYCNGDSYSDENYHESLLGNTYANFVSKACNGFVINKAITGSCNRRIIRTTVHDAIQLRQLNPDQQIIILIGLSFDVRSEVWDEDKINTIPEESQFKTHNFSKHANQSGTPREIKDIDSSKNFKPENKFLKQYSAGRAYFYSPYAERINLLCDCIMLRSLLDSLNIDFLIFQSPLSNKLESDYLLDFFKNQLSPDPRVFDFETFGFCHWCTQQNFTPLDFLDRPTIGHYKSDAHQAFAEQILLPKLHELKIL